MIQVAEIADLDGLMPLLSEQKYRPDLSRYRSWYVYRGMSDVSFKLYTSLRRNCREKMSVLEPAILKNFTKYAAREDPSIEKSVWRQMILGQHHGLPTRLLDWSHSPLVGLHFAVTEADLDHMEAHDCVVWRVDMTSEWSPKMQSAWAASVRAETWKTPGRSSPAILYMFGIIRRRPWEAV